MYTVEGLSIGEITRQLNREAIPTRKASRWERSVVWALLTELRHEEGEKRAKSFRISSGNR